MSYFIFSLKLLLHNVWYDVEMGGQTIIQTLFCYLEHSLKRYIFILLVVLLLLQNEKKINKNSHIYCTAFHRISNSIWIHHSFVLNFLWIYAQCMPKKINPSSLIVLPSCLFPNLLCFYVLRVRIFSTTREFMRVLSFQDCACFIQI